MKKDLIATPLLPFTSDEESALVERLGAMDSSALGHYVDSARLALGNTALDASWRPRVEIGLKHAEAALVKEAAAAAIAAEAAARSTPPTPAPPTAPVTATAKAKGKKTEA